MDMLPSIHATVCGRLLCTTGLSQYQDNGTSVVAWTSKDLFGAQPHCVVWCRKCSSMLLAECHLEVLCTQHVTGSMSRRWPPACVYTPFLCLLLPPGATAGGRSGCYAAHGMVNTLEPRPVPGAPLCVRL